MRRAPMRQMQARPQLGQRERRHVHTLLERRVATMRVRRQTVHDMSHSDYWTTLRATLPRRTHFVYVRRRQSRRGRCGETRVDEPGTRPRPRSDHVCRKKFLHLFSTVVTTVTKQKFTCLKLFRTYDGIEETTCKGDYANVEECRAKMYTMECQIPPHELRSFQLLWDKRAQRRCTECNIQLMDEW